MIVEPGMPLIEGHSARQTGGTSSMWSLCLDHVGAGDLVVPALLLCIERGPDDTNEERHARDDEPDVAGNEVDIATVKDRD
jgi:hypothetical protein